VAAALLIVITPRIPSGSTDVQGEAETGTLSA
jgi:hypothetical protein